MPAPQKIVIVGGVAGGATAAARLRRRDETSQIILVERGAYVSFANCGLPYYVGDVISQRERLLVQTAEKLSQRFHLDIRTFSEVIAIDRVRQVVTIKEVQGETTYEETYDVLILSPGAQPIVPPIPGLAEADCVFTVRSIPDTDQLKAFLDQHTPETAVVIGGGFIGLEMAENLVHRGIQVTLVEMLNQVMAPLDYEMAALVHHHLAEYGVQLVLGDGVKALEQHGRRVILQSGTMLNTDVVLLAIGVRPENTLAVQADLAIGKRGGILVDDALRTSDEHIYAIGDAIEVRDYITGMPAQIPLAGPANRQARMVADTLTGTRRRYAGTLGTAIVQVFDLTIATTGANEKMVRSLQLPYNVVHTHPASHATYYPGAQTMALKLVFNPDTGALYGAQAVGREGVDKRIDVLATAIKGGLTVFDLQELELAYAPPYSSAKDPVNMLGYIAVNMMEGMVQTVQYDEIDALVEQGGLLIDVREPEEVARGSIPGSVNIPLGELRQRIPTLPKDQNIYVTCQVGIRGYLACRILAGERYRAINLDGGYQTYTTVYGRAH